MGTRITDPSPEQIDALVNHYRRFLRSERSERKAASRAAAYSRMSLTNALPYLRERGFEIPQKSVKTVGGVPKSAVRILPKKAVPQDSGAYSEDRPYAPLTLEQLRANHEIDQRGYRFVSTVLRGEGA
jgi:hypothetical protein